MAKINKFIVAYSDAISEAGIDLNCYIPPKKSYTSLCTYI